MAAKDLRAALAACGARRKKHDKEGAQIAKDTRTLLRRVDNSPDVTATEAAEKIGVHRTTLYRVYGKKKK